MPVLKWAPHNELTYSAFDSATPTNWSVGFGTGTYNHTLGSEISNLPTITQEQTASGRSYLTQNVTLKANTIYTLKMLVDENLSSITDGNNKILSANISGASGTLSASIDDVSDGKVEITFTTGSTTSGTVRTGIGVLNDAVGTVVFAAPHLYRSDLGGMVDNPDRGDSYVPTTSSAKQLPRVGHHVYNGSAWVNEGLLAESESRTNLVDYSDFSSGWIDGGAGSLNLTENSAVSPDGTQNALEVESTGSGSSSYIKPSSAVFTNGLSVTVSVYVKAGTHSIVRIANNNSNDNGAWFDLSDGTIGTDNDTGGHGNTASIEEVGNGWYRLSRYFGSVTTGSNDIIIGPSNADGGTGVAPANTTMYFYGVQAEVGATRSSLIPTSGGNGDRAAETFTIPSANLPWPTPQYIGSELVDNGDFATTSDWSLQSGVSIGGGVLSSDGTSTGELARQSNIGVTSGNLYAISLDVISLTAGKFGVKLGGTTPIYFDTTGSHEALIVATATDNVQIMGLSGTTGSVDNISVREINPLSVSIGMEGRMTYADTDQTYEVEFFRWRKDGTAQIFTRLKTDVGTGRLDFFSEENNVLHRVNTDNSFYSPDINIPINFASRHGSTFVNGAVDGVALTANTTPTALPDLSSSDLGLAQTYMGTISEFRVWDKDLGDAGIVEATNPSLEPSLSLTFEGTGTNSFVIQDWSE
jgi:hypothetical protein